MRMLEIKKQLYVRFATRAFKEGNIPKDMEPFLKHILDKFADKWKAPEWYFVHLFGKMLVISTQIIHLFTLEALWYLLVLGFPYGEGRVLPGWEHPDELGLPKGATRYAMKVPRCLQCCTHLYHLWRIPGSDRWSIRLISQIIFWFWSTHRTAHEEDYEAFADLILEDKL